jgi:hypothetical protein
MSWWRGAEDIENVPASAALYHGSAPQVAIFFALIFVKKVKKELRLMDDPGPGL